LVEPVAQLDAEAQVRLFKALGDPTRLAVLRILPDKPICQDMYSVAELVDEIGGSQPNMSRHLHVLKAAGLVRCRKACCSVYYYRDGQAFRQAERLLAELRKGG
jgi:ArsR family transcriptional regulator